MAWDDDRLDEWVRGIAPRAVAYARSLLDRPDAAEDVVQDVFLRLLGHPEYDLLRDGDKLVFRSVTNACINARTRARELRQLAAEEGEDPPAAAEAADPARIAQQRELAAAVHGALRELPATQRAAVELRALGGSMQDIADALGTSPQNAGVLVHRGRRRLREVLDARWAGELA